MSGDNDIDTKRTSLTRLECSPNATPEVRMRVLDERIKERRNKQDHELNDRWQSCCFTCDKRVITYFTQVGVITGIIIFCMVQLVNHESCEYQTTYVGLLTLLVGLIIPSPAIKR